MGGGRKGALEIQLERQPPQSGAVTPTRRGLECSETRVVSEQVQHQLLAPGSHLLYIVLN